MPFNDYFGVKESYNNLKNIIETLNLEKEKENALLESIDSYADDLFNKNIVFNPSHDKLIHHSGCRDGMAIALAILMKEEIKCKALAEEYQNFFHEEHFSFKFHLN